MAIANKDIENLLIAVVAFKNYYRSKLADEELLNLNQWIKTLQTVEYVPIYNNHYVTCVYSEIGGVCICQSILFIRSKFSVLRQRYSLAEDLQLLIGNLKIN